MERLSKISSQNRYGRYSRRCLFWCIIGLACLICSGIAERPDSKLEHKLRQESIHRQTKTDNVFDKTSQEGTTTTNTTTNDDEPTPSQTSTDSTIDGEPSSSTTTTTSSKTSQDPNSVETATETNTPSPTPQQQEESSSSGCDSLQSCEACKSLSESMAVNNDDKTCYWDDQACTEVSLKDVTDDSVFAFNCEVEQTKSTDQTTPQPTTNQKDTEPNDPTNTQQNTTQDTKHDNVDENQENSSSSKLSFLLIGFVVAGFVIRKKMLERNSSSPTNHSNVHVPSDIFGARSGMSGRPNPEIVPLSAGDDWDWDDGGDLELSHANVEEKEDLEMALAMSLSEKVDAKKALQTTNTKPSIPKPISTNISPAPKTTIAANDSWDDEAGWDDDSGWDDDLPVQTTNSTQKLGVSTFATPTTTTTTTTTTATSSTTTSLRANPPLQSNITGGLSSSITTTTTAPTRNKEMPIPMPTKSDDIQSLLRETGGQITSFGKKNNSSIPKSKPQRKPAEEDDIFASMGLSSFGTTTTSTSGKNNIPKAPSSVPQQASFLSSSNVVQPVNNTALTADDGSEEGSNWDDEGDLDDLLDD